MMLIACIGDETTGSCRLPHNLVICVSSEHLAVDLSRHRTLLMRNPNILHGEACQVDNIATFDKHGVI